MKRSVYSLLCMLLMMSGCAVGGNSLYRKYDPPWLMSWNNPEEVKSDLTSAIPIGMSRPEAEAVLRQKGVKNWDEVPALYHDSIAVDPEAGDCPFRYIGERGGVPHGDDNYALYQPSRISIIVPSYRGVPKRSVACILYPPPELGIAIIRFDSGRVVSAGYTPLPDHEYSNMMYTNRAGEQ